MRSALAIISVCACGGSDPVTVDAKTADAYDTARCLITGDYGDLGAKSGTAGVSGTGATTITINLDPGPPGKDDYFMKLVSGKGVFAGGIAAGSYTIAGADAQFNNCGLCVNLIADIKPTTGPSKFYQATSGNVAFTSVTPPIAGAATNLHFDEVDITTGNLIVGGCTGSVSQITFSTP